MTAFNWEGSQAEGFGVCSEDKLQSQDYIESDMTEQLTHTTILEAFLYKMYMRHGILWIGKLGVLQSMGLQRVGHD